MARICFKYWDFNYQPRLVSRWISGPSTVVDLMNCRFNISKQLTKQPYQLVSGFLNHPTILLMAKILHQLRLVVYPTGFIHPRWCRISSLQGYVHPKKRLRINEEQLAFAREHLTNSPSQAAKKIATSSLKNHREFEFHC